MRGSAVGTSPNTSVSQLKPDCSSTFPGLNVFPLPALSQPDTWKIIHRSSKTVAFHSPCGFFIKQSNSYSWIKINNIAKIYIMVVEQTTKTDKTKKKIQHVHQYLSVCIMTPPSGFPLCSGYISPYIPPLVIIQIPSATRDNIQNVEQYTKCGQLYWRLVSMHICLLQQSAVYWGTINNSNAKLPGSGYLENIQLKY